MDFALTDEQELIRKSARALAEAEILPRAKEADRQAKFPEAQIRALGTNGFLAMLVPEEYGGAAAGAVAYSLAIAEIARCCAATCVTMAVTNMVCDAIANFGTEDQKRRFIAPLARGEWLAGSFALSEPGAGSDAASIQTNATRRGDRWILEGTKCWITSGDRAGVVLVMAKTNPAAGARGITAFLVDPASKGFSVGRHEEKMGIRASSTVTLHFDGVEVPDENRLGDEGRGFAIAMRALDGGRIGVGSQALGIGLAACEGARAYALERKQFGQAIANFESIQWKIADMATELDAARLLVLRAASMKDAGIPFTRHASMAKLFATEAANRATYEAVQVLGGSGYVSEFPIERYFRDCRVTTIYEGTSEIQRLVIARALLAEQASTRSH